MSEDAENPFPEYPQETEVGGNELDFMDEQQDATVESNPPFGLEDEVADLKELVLDLQERLEMAEANLTVDDALSTPFVADVGTDGSFTELAPYRGGVVPFASGRTGTCTLLSSTQAVIVEKEDAGGMAFIGLSPGEAGTSSGSGTLTFYNTALSGTISTTGDYYDIGSVTLASGTWLINGQYQMDIGTYGGSVDSMQVHLEINSTVLCGIIDYGPLVYLEANWQAIPGRVIVVPSSTYIHLWVKFEGSGRLDVSANISAVNIGSSQ
jgi:hypothetical protein